VFTARYELGMYFSLVFTIFVSRFNCLVCVMQIEHGVCVCVCVCVCLCLCLCLKLALKI